jgi:hypothetical protein
MLKQYLYNTILKLINYLCTQIYKIIPKTQNEK